jgi:hypothetical protein
MTRSLLRTFPRFPIYNREIATHFPGQLPGSLKVTYYLTGHHNGTGKREKVISHR